MFNIKNIEILKENYNPSEILPEVRLKSFTRKSLPTTNDPEECIGERNKLGGEPTWIQGDETPICPECNKKMIFHGQLDQVDEHHCIEDVGLIYVFMCYDCNKVKSVVQSF